MAVTTIEGPASTQVVLSSSYLTSTNYVEGSNADWVTLWIDDAGAIDGDVKVSINGGAECPTPLAAGVHWTIYPGRAASWTIDAKADSGTPNLNVLSGIGKR